jgi:anti-anti-sigma regulatory factor
MLRITVHDEAGCRTFQLEGRLAGTWVEELRNCVTTTQTTGATAVVRFDLREVTYVDGAGKAFLAEAHARGAELVASGCLMLAIVAELASNHRQPTD